MHIVILSVHFDRFLASSQDLLHTVFRNGKIVKTYTFDDVRDNAKLKESELKDLLLWERLPSALSPPTPTRENLRPDRREDTQLPHVQCTELFYVSVYWLCYASVSLSNGRWEQFMLFMLFKSFNCVFDQVCYWSHVLAGMETFMCAYTARFRFAWLGLKGNRSVFVECECCV